MAKSGRSKSKSRKASLSVFSNKSGSVFVVKKGTKSFTNQPVKRIRVSAKKKREVARILTGK